MGKLGKASTGKVQSLQERLDDVRSRISKHHDAIESGDLDLSLVGDRLRQLKTEEADPLEQVERAHGPRPTPPYLLKEDSLRSIEENLRSVFVSGETEVAKRYLEFGPQRVDIEGDEVRLEGNGATLLSPELHRTKTGTVNHEDPVPTFDLDWLPNPGNCKNHIIAFVLRREKPEECVQTAPRQDRRKLRRPPLVVAREFQKLLDDGVVNSRAEIARRYGISRARVTQIMGLLRLPTAVQEQLLALPEDEQTRYPERRLRTIAALRTEAARGRAFEALSGAVIAGSGSWVTAGRDEGQNWPASSAAPGRG